MGSCCSGQNDEDSDNKYGKAKTHDPSFDGPIHKRSCTDILCCLIFFIFILGFIVVGIFAWLNGDPIILLYPTDNNGRICGVKYGDLDLSNKTNVFFFDLTKCASPASLLKFQCATTQICVNSCPNSTWTYYQDVPQLTAALAGVIATGVTSPTNLQISNFAVSNLGVDWSKYFCTYGYDVRTEFESRSNGFQDLIDIIQEGKCAPYYIPMTPLVGRCIPTVLKDAASFTSKTVSGESTVVVDALNNTVTGDALNNGSLIVQAYLNAQEVGMKIFADFTVAWYWVLAGLGVAAVVSFLWIVIMRWVAGPMIWITIIALLGVFGFGIYYCYTEWQRLLNVDGADRSVIAIGFTSDLNQYLALQDTWLAFFIILCILGGVFLLLVIFLRKRILIAIQIIKSASKAVGMMISTLFYPLVTFVLAVIVVSFWAATALFLASSGDPVYRVIDSNETRVAAEATPLNNTNCNVTLWNQANHTYANDSSIKCAFIEYGGDSVFHQNTLWLQIACLFGLFWLLNWVIALGECTLAGAFASYYWAFKKPRDIPALPLFGAFGRTLRYHTGSLAFGAFIIALIQIIRVMLEYIDHKVKSSESKVAKFVIKCCKCCFWCLEKFMKFLNRNAYIMVAVYGKNFCWSAKEAFKLIMRNIIRVAVVDKVTDFLLFMGKLIVTSGLVALSWAFFSNQISFVSGYVPSLNYYWLPIVVIGIGAYIVAAGFFNTYGMAVDTIFLCFLEDLERNDGTPERPYFANKELLELFGRKNTQTDREPIYEEVE
uniref:choline transporter-like protein 2 isoform X1 n=1 Tax=Styela clava TaxID=7725 RepID=UPI00193A4654|nr:choline transporter-like protein 2 isoform X1 [Styela clava]